MLFKRIKDWATSITAFRSGDVIPVDGPNGTAKMTKDSLLQETAQSTLAGNLAPAFDPTRTRENPYLAGQSVVYNGVVKTFIVDHYGPWNDDDAFSEPFSVGLGTLNAKIDGGYYTLKTYSSSEISQKLPVDGTYIVRGETNYFDAGVPTLKIQYYNANDSLIAQSDNIQRGPSGYFEILFNNANVAKLKVIKGGSSDIVDRLSIAKYGNGLKFDVNSLSESLHEQQTRVTALQEAVTSNTINLNGGFYPFKNYNTAEISSGIAIDEVNIVLGLNYVATTAEVSTLKVVIKNSSNITIGQLDNIQKNSNGMFEVSINNRDSAIVYFYRGGSGILLTQLTIMKYTDGALDAIHNVENNLRLYKETFSGESISGNGAIYEECVFLHCNVHISDGEVFENCDFVNTIITNDVISKNVTISNCNFIGSDSRIYVKCLESCQIVGNEFPPTSAKYPDATPKTKGEFSRNINAWSINNCRIERNHIYIGRTGICILGDPRLRDHICDCSSRYNSIVNNIIEGIGEEHISFDGGVYNDGSKVVRIDDISFTWVSTGQIRNDGGEDSDQTKMVADVTMIVTSQVSPKNAKVYANYKGMHVVGLKNSLHYELTRNIELIGETSVDTDDGLVYATNGTYKIFFRVPTQYTYKDTVTQAQKDEITQKINSDFDVDDYISIASIQSDNTISGNIINGIGTDRSYDIEDMGGIVLYGMCFHNTIANNVLRQKRIWLESFNRKKNVKMCSDNVIANNCLDETCISVLTWITNPLLPTTAKLNQRNAFIGNVVNGSAGVAVIDVRSSTDTTFIGNSSRKWVLRNNSNMKLTANRTKEPVDASANSGTASDTTDGLAL